MMSDCMSVGRGRRAARPLIKVCGLSRAEDVALCEELGVDWIGFIFHPASPRHANEDFVAALPRGRALRVGVFVRQSADEVRAVMERVGLDLAQLHCGQDLAFCRAVGEERVIKVFWPQRFADVNLLEQDLERFTPFCRAVLLDAGISGGGHGRSLDFILLRDLRCSVPWILAGGLGPKNILSALTQCSPDGVDLNSGIEDEPGKKNREKLSQAIQRIRLNMKP